MASLTRRKRNQAAIDEQIAGLQKMRGSFPHYSAFDGDNWAKIDAQIAVLKGEAKPDDYYIDEKSEDYKSGDNETWSEAERAERWMNGQESENLYE